MARLKRQTGRRNRPNDGDKGKGEKRGKETQEQFPTGRAKKRRKYPIMGEDCGQETEETGYKEMEERELARTRFLRNGPEDCVIGEGKYSRLLGSGVTVKSGVERW